VIEAQRYTAHSARLPTTTTKKTPYPKRRYIAAAAAALLAVSGVLVSHSPTLHAETETPKTKTIRLSEVHKHGRKADAQWVTKGTRVYDITEWIPAHPGGEVILRAVGGSIDKYWEIFTIHKKDDVYDILESYFIGEIDPCDLVDGKVPADEVDDPFQNDPKRDGRLKQHSQRPCNAETPEEDLSEYITPNSVFYVRNHLWVPNADASNYALTVELPDGTEKSYSMKDLKDKFKEVDITATLQCSGNRRRHMSEEARPASGLPWGVGAIGNAKWTGVLLRDVLAEAGFPVDEWPKDAKHVQFMGAEAYGASIPIEKAVDRRGDVLLAYRMNGEELPADHGYPVRVIVPGHVAARNVKWVQKITVSDEESTSQWQRRDYKCFGPNEGDKPDWNSGRAIQETSVQSAITSLREISTHSAEDRAMLQVYGLEEDSVALEGYCYSGGGREILRVDVSADNGRTWQQAEILPGEQLGNKAWAWKRWRFVLPKRKAGTCFVVKAVDEANNTQPDTYEPHYNFKGNLTTAWHRVGYRAK
jgi:sulfite oxidase